MHIHSENGAAVWAAMCEAMPGECTDDTQAPDTASTGEDAVRVLDEAGLDKGVILSLGYGYEEAALFIDRIARHAPAVTFQLAHMAGWGGYDPGTDGAIQAFLDAIENGVLDRSKIWFDTAAVLEAQLPDDVYADLQRRLIEIGFDRLLFATDWDEVDPKSYLARLKEHLTLSDAEWDQFMSNQAPYLH